MEEVLALSITPPFMYHLYVTIIMITLRRLPVPLVPHTPLQLYITFLRTTSSSIPFLLCEFYLFINLMSESNIIIGYFNIATNLLTNHSKYLLNIQSSSNLKLHNTYPTHKYGNTPDLLISHNSSNLICSHSVGPCISDQNIIFFTFHFLNLPNPLSLILSAKQKSSTLTISSDNSYPFHITRPMNYVSLF